MIQSFFLISNTGEVLIEKHWRGLTPRTVCDFFWDEANKYENKEEMPPVVSTSKYYLISIYRNEVFLLVATTGEIAPLLAIEFLHRVYDIFEEYFGTVEESTIKDNFATVYQLLEEMMDFGYPLTTEPNALKAMIKPNAGVLSRLTSAALGESGGGVSDVLPDGTISNMPWRKTGVKYAQNEIYLDIVEEIDCILDKNGNIISSEVSGQIMANSRLSGVPDLALTFSDPGVIDDCSFHPCVRYTRFERDKVVSFVPPDGAFELMKYRVNTSRSAYSSSPSSSYSPSIVHVAAPVFCLPILTFDFSTGQGSLSLSIGTKPQHSLIYPGNKKQPVIVEDVVVVIPFSRSVRTATLTASSGTVLFDEASKVAKWTVGKLTSEKSPTLSGPILLSPGTGEGREEAPPIQMQWKVPMSSVSGLSVASLQLTNEQYKPYKKCLALRDKWISEQPPAPQDRLQDIHYTFSHPISSPHPHSPANESHFFPPDSTLLPPPPPPTLLRRSSSAVTPDGYRRRPSPAYEVFGSPIPPSVAHLYQYRVVNGVVRVWRAAEPFEASILKRSKSDLMGGIGVLEGLGEEGEDEMPPSDFPVLSFEQFVEDFNILRRHIYSGPTLSYAHKRLELLSAKFSLHVLLNSGSETEAQKSVPHRDFYNVRKVDTHVHHSACMNQKHLLRFIKHKLKHHPNEVVVFRDGKFLTLEEVFKSLHLSAYDLSIDTLDMHANNTFHRFDRFNLKYNPAGQSRLREIFLKTENVLGGSYLAEITKEVIDDLETGKYTLVEWRISIYGRKASEWESLSRWFYCHRLAHQNVRWLIQVPRLYHIYRKGGELRSFGQMMSNIFAPLFAVTLDPSSNLPLHYFLMTVVGFDSVDDESRPEHGQLSTTGPASTPDPDQWTMAENPPYGYWMYYMYANICVLNKLRASLGLNTFQFRPHCGEAGDPDHLISTFLVANQINHGILLRKNAALHYLYYLSQIGIAVSPLSNNKLFLEFNKSPFIRYFQQGMNVSLSTDDPLMLHITKDALLEEYSVAAQVWKLSSTDQCEIARNSVLQSGWEDRFKKHFLGADYSDIRETNVPEIRLMFRREALEAERSAVKQHAR